MSSASSRTISGVEIVALIASVVAVLISLGSFLLARRADGRATRAEKREQQAEQRDEQRAQREIENALLARRGDPVVEFGPVHGGPTANPVTHDFTIRNGGRASITDLRLRIEDERGATVSAPAGGPGTNFSPGGPAVVSGVSVAQPLPEGELTLVVEWTDEVGTHIKRVGRASRHA